MVYSRWSDRSGTQSLPSKLLSVNGLSSSVDGKQSNAEKPSTRITVLSLYSLLFTQNTFHIILKLFRLYLLLDLLKIDLSVLFFNIQTKK